MSDKKAGGKANFVMSEEQKGLFDRLTPLQQKVCLNSISGMSNIDSYISAGGKGKTQASKENSASQIFSKLEVVAFLDSMKAVAVNDAIASREELMEFHTRMIRLDLSPLHDMTLEELTELKGGIDVRLRAAQNSSKQLADLAGYEAPKQIEVTEKEELTPWGAIELGTDE